MGVPKFSIQARMVKNLKISFLCLRSSPSPQFGGADLAHEAARCNKKDSTNVRYREICTPSSNFRSWPILLKNSILY